MFFNAAYFKRTALAAAEREGPALRWFVLDMIPLTQLDITGMDALKDLQAELARRGVALVAAGRRTEVALWLAARGLDEPMRMERHFRTLRQAERAYRATHGEAGAPAGSDGNPTT